MSGSAYNPSTDRTSSDEVARAVKAAFLGLVLGLLMAALARTRDRRT
jgi:predicted benzoate:H+ symporter BenE